MDLLNLGRILFSVAVSPSLASALNRTAVAPQSMWPAARIKLEAPRAVGRFEPAEFVLRVAEPHFENPFTNVELIGRFATAGNSVAVRGFADAQDGSVFRLRFCPNRADTVYTYEIVLRGPNVERRFEGRLRCEPSDRPGPVIVDREHPRHFVRAGTGGPFYHLGYTAYHLLDPSNTDEQIDELIRYCRREGFNKIRFLLTGYPRDFAEQTSHDEEHGVPDPWRAPNYGAAPGQVNPLPAWPGQPHHYDFSRFNVGHWQRVDRAVARLRDAGIVATCIFTIEKQGLPKELGALSEAEYRLYRYAIARLAAFDNVWWDLGNEHNEYRDRRWGAAMGAFVKSEDPYDRLLSAHAYKEFLYPDAGWADFIITQQYGDEQSVHDWVAKYLEVRKPYVNEEYGYEGEGKRNQKGQPNAPGHGQSGDWVRRCHWSIAMAGGYATYGDWSGGVSYFYMGEPGPGRGAKQLKHLRVFFEDLPFRELAIHDEWVTEGFCLAKPPEHYVFYLPRGGQARIDLTSAGAGPLKARWFDPRTGQWLQGPAAEPGRTTVTAPDARDWVLHVRGEGP